MSLDEYICTPYQIMTLIQFSPSDQQLRGLCLPEFRLAYKISPDLVSASSPTFDRGGNV